MKGYHKGSQEGSQQASLPSTIRKINKNCFKDKSWVNRIYWKDGILR